MTILFHAQYEDIPYYLVIGKKKHYLTNNVFYGGVHFMVRKRIVDTCKVILYEKLRRLKPFDPKNYPVDVELVYHSSKTTFDIDNRGSFWTKVVVDALKEKKVIPDDNVRFISSISMKHRTLDKGTPDMLEITVSHS